MTLGPIRPRFRVVVPDGTQAIVARLEAAVGDPASGCVSRTVGHHVDITVAEGERHRWSPCLQLELGAGPDGTTIAGLIGPHPHLWTFFALIHATAATVAALGLILGFAQWSLGMTAWGLGVAAGGLVAMAVTYAVSQVGQRLAVEQTQRITALVERAIGVELHAPAAGRSV